MNKHAKTSGGLIAIIVIGVIIVGILGYVALGTTQQTAYAPCAEGLVRCADGTCATICTGEEAVPCGQNPAITLSFVNALTKQSITATTALNYKDKISGDLPGNNPSLESGQFVTPIMNLSGYITEVQPEYKVKCGNQQITGDLYQYANVTIKIYNDAGTAQIGGTNGTTQNDTAFTTQVNHKILLTGNTYKSGGRMFVIYELSNATSVDSVALSESGAGTTIPTVTVPGCYENSLGGTPYVKAWELPAIVGGAQKSYNLQVVAKNGNTVSEEAFLTIYAEEDSYDTLTGAFLTSGICDSNNAAYWKDVQSNSFYYL